MKVHDTFDNILKLSKLFYMNNRLVLCIIKKELTKEMKKIICISSILVVILIILCSCGTTRLNANNISKITVTTLPGDNKSLKTTKNKNEISNIINYLNGLKLKKTTEDGGQYNGSSYIINIYFNDKTSKEYVLCGNRFLKESGNWYEMQYDQAVKFDNIYKSIGNK